MNDTIKPEGTPRQMAALNRYLPRLAQTVSNVAGPYEQAMLNARATIDPQQAALDESLAAWFMPRFAQIGSDVARQNAFNQATTEADVLEGPGARLVSSARQLDRFQDPEYYDVREAGAGRMMELLAGQDPNQLTGAEIANVERTSNRTNTSQGTAGLGSSLSAIGNAMTFGGALDKKRNTLLNTLNAIPQNLAAMRSGTDVFQVATGRPSYGSNPAVNNMSNNLLGEAGQNVRQNNDLTANARDWLDRTTQVMGALPSD
jgi:hypothetical protein